MANLYSKDISVIEKLKNQFILSINPHYSFITGDYSAVVGLLTGEKTLEIEAELLKQNLFVKFQQLLHHYCLIVLYLYILIKIIKLIMIIY